VEEAGGAPDGFDHATSAKIEQAVECAECGRTIPAGDWLWLFSQGELEKADEIKVVCEECAEALGCGPIDHLSGNGR
jgi:hypothetical protein